MIKKNAERIISELPSYVELVAAAKFTDTVQITEAIQGGVKIIGENYVQEAENDFKDIGNKVKWHFIGHLQRNKVKKAVKIFDMIETLDSQRLAKTINKESAKIGKIMPVLIEINSAIEENKSGILPEGLDDFVKSIIDLPNLNIQGLMTMGPLSDEPQDIRPYFKKAKNLFDRVKDKYADKLDFRYLSMGMTHSYKVAIEEGANIVRIGTAIFGNR